MNTSTSNPLVGIELVRLLAYEGDRIFTTDRARELAPQSASRTPTVRRHSTSSGETTGSFRCAEVFTPCPPQFPAYRTPMSSKLPWPWSIQPPSHIGRPYITTA